MRLSYHFPKCIILLTHVSCSHLSLHHSSTSGVFEPCMKSQFLLFAKLHAAFTQINFPPLPSPPLLPSSRTYLPQRLVMFGHRGSGRRGGHPGWSRGRRGLWQTIRSRTDCGSAPHAEVFGDVGEGFASGRQRVQRFGTHGWHREILQPFHLCVWSAAEQESEFLSTFSDDFCGASDSTELHLELEIVDCNTSSILSFEKQCSVALKIVQTPLKLRVLRFKTSQESDDMRIWSVLTESMSKWC